MGFREIASLMELVSSKLQVAAMTSPCKPPCTGGQHVLGQFGNEDLTTKVDNNRSSLSSLKHGQSKAALSCVATPPAEFLFQQTQKQVSSTTTFPQLRAKPSRLASDLAGFEGSGLGHRVHCLGFRD